MTIALALEYIPRRMKELGYGNDYTLRYRHLVLAPRQRYKIHGHQDVYLLIEPTDVIAVRSDTGIFDPTLEAVNEQQYEHQGAIRLRNYSSVLQHLRMIQVIPQN